MFRFIAAGFSGLLLAGCTSSQTVGLTDLASLSSPTDPGVGIGVVRYQPILGGYTPRTPSEPSGWRNTGVEIAPVGNPSLPESDGESSERGAAQ